MIKSRLRERRPQKEIDVYAKAFASGQHTESIVYNGLAATYEQTAAIEIVSDGGAVVIVEDVFWFGQQTSGTLPAIEEKHILVDSGNSARYEVVAVADQGGGGDRLKVMTRSLR